MNDNLDNLSHENWELNLRFSINYYKNLLISSVSQINVSCKISIFILTKIRCCGLILPTIDISQEFLAE